MADFSPMDPARVAELVAQVDRAEAIHARVDSRDHDPRPGSQAASDEAVPHARFVRMTADICAGVAADHLVTWRLLVRGGRIPIYSPMTLLRVALEGAVMVRWLVDDGPPLERVGRGVAAEIDSYAEQRKFEVDAKRKPPPPGGGKMAADRGADLVTARDRDGIPIVPILGYTELVRRYGVSGGRKDARWLYRLLSAFTHAKPWMLHALKLGTPSDAGPGLKRGLVTASDVTLIGATMLVSANVERALDDLERYLGVVR